MKTIPRRPSDHAKLADWLQPRAPYKLVPTRPSFTEPQLMTRLITLSELRCFHGDVETDLPKQKLRFALLVYLAMERNATRDKVMALLWPEVDQERARGRLN